MLSAQMAAAATKLYVLPGSHPCAAVEAALALKGIDYRRVDLLPIAPVLAGPLLYGGTTVPGMRIGGNAHAGRAERLVGSRPIMRRLDELAPEPALLPPEGDGARERVLEAERWGDEVLQSVPRRLIDAAFLRDPASIESYAGDAKLPLPRGLLRPMLPLTARAMALKNRANDSSARADLLALPGLLDRVDGWVDEGLLGGEHPISGHRQPNAADLQIGSAIRLLSSIGDVAPLIAGRPCERLSGYFPAIAGHVPAGALPAEWLAVVAAGAPAVNGAASTAG
jgi:glutathione S-transferase